MVFFMSPIVFYGNTRAETQINGQVFHEVEPSCLATWQVTMRDYGISEDCMEVAVNAPDLKNKLENATLRGRKVTVIIPGGHGGLMTQSLSAGNIDKWISAKAQEGRLNCFGSCAGMYWLMGLRDEKAEVFPECRAIFPFQSMRSEHLDVNKAPIFTGVLPGSEPCKFQSFWNSGIGAVFSGQTSVFSIADYHAEELSKGEIFRFQCQNYGWLEADGKTVQPKYHPHAGIMRVTEGGGVVAGLGFHPEMPIAPEDLTLGISYEENSLRSRRFLYSVLDRFELK